MISSMDTSSVSCFLYVILVSYQLLLLQLHYSVSAADDESTTSGFKPGCQQKIFKCGKFGDFKFPYTNETNHTCAPGRLDCSGEIPKLSLGSLVYEVKHFPTEETVEVIFPPLTTLISRNSCDIFNFYISFPNSGAVSFTFTPNITLLKCSKNEPPPYNHTMIGIHSCGSYKIYYPRKKGVEALTDLQTPPPDCQIITLPAAPDDVRWGSSGSSSSSGDLFSQLASEFTIRFHVSTQCHECINKGNRCSLRPSNFYCHVLEDDKDTLNTAVDYKSSGGGDVFSDLDDEFTIRFDVSNECRNCIKNGQQCPAHEYPGSSCVRERVVNTPKKEGNPRGRKLPLILGTAGGFLIVLCLLFLGVRYRKKWSNVSSYVFARTTSSDPSSTLDPEGGNMYFGVPIFSYAELQDATNNFDPSTELGDGGFGTVYLGKLKDGREVAVKRLYERNYKRVTQFQNEIEILTRLRHKNLVSLYGCTSSQSRELLLVYEYIPNGTVADHLHGDRANNGPLTWPNRIHIALETASALVYLHASEIIHRDVKTNNILLDQNFTVKVADFGLSRLFPTDKTHVSTAPQGTPGYVDPEYHQCYQLTEKSDVYSFGVVLAELISSLPAVDISRHRHEINLANLAVNKIQSGELGDFVDPNLGFGSDPLTERMITSVAEVAFRCLQVDKDMRPSMDEVLETLQEIADYKDEKEGEKLDKVGSGKTAAWVTPSPESEDVILLKNRNVSTPDSMTDKWTSGSTTSTSNG